MLASESFLLRDSDIGQLTGFSVSWVRQQRHLRKMGKPHSFNVGPVFVGSAPRYRATEVFDWLNALSAKIPALQD